MSSRTVNSAQVSDALDQTQKRLEQEKIQAIAKAQHFKAEKYEKALSKSTMRKAIDQKAQKLIDDKAAVDYRNNILLKNRAIEKTLEKA